MAMWLEATLACWIPLFISLETTALLQSRLQDAGTMKPFAEMFRVADSGQGLLGQEPAVCTGAFPITGPSGEACSEKQKTKRHRLSRLTHISEAAAQGTLALGGQHGRAPRALLA